MKSSGLVRAGVSTAALVGGFVVALRTVLHSSQSYPEAGLAIVTFGAICLAPVAVAMVGWRRDSGPMLVAASVLCGLLALLSVATLPYLIPAALLVAASIGSRWSATAALAAGATAVLVVAAGVALLIRPEERCVSTATSETCGRIATTADALLSLGLAAAGIGLALVLAVATTGPPIIPGDGAAADPREPGHG